MPIGAPPLPGRGALPQALRMRQMPALPADAREPGPARLTGLTCPECPGSLTVQAEGGDHLVFTCRVGHTFSTQELVADKEKRVERLLWAAVEALEELSAFLRDVGVDPDRARSALLESAAIRQVLEATVPAQLDKTAACTDGQGEG